MSAKPTPKVAAVGVSGALTVLIVWVAGLCGIDMPAEVAAAISVVVTFGAGYIKSEVTERDGSGGEHVAR
ncbi:holin [Arthrobacter phage Laila]|nr:holin [Arthrobacter phage Taj14]ASR83525.1 holin [Arthrobacter phage Elkhorn]ASR83552.1 holin [Arthrobacter phage KylieMac]ASR83700.1 holin [Arthrobacter phage Lore]ASR83998.1 holin [Arthrobacter phage Swenson]QBP30104.1 holin [Arthrobacter phage Blair]QBP30790.1 holin [Arthrobacter phage StewieGriff]QDB74344.1 holin [Arthrobacter phage Laila]QGH75239.1 holin [Arthrobacter phage Saphira]